MAIIGLDVGTTCCKCALYNNDGAQIKITAAEYSIVRDKGHQYADVRSMWLNVKKILKEVAEYSNNIEGICVTSFGESFVPVTKSFEILFDSMLYTDLRGTEQSLRLKKTLSDEEAFKITGNKIHPMYSLPKMMWYKENQREIYERTDYLLPIGSFIQFMLSGEAACDYSLCSRTMALDIYNKVWSRTLLDTAEIDIQKLPSPVKCGQIIGSLRKEISLELGMDRRCKVIAGAHDQVAAALGAGNLNVGSSVDGIGTVECITPIFNRPITDIKMANDGYSCIPYVLDNTYVTYLFNYTGGALINWFRDKLVPEICPMLSANGTSFYNYYAKLMPKTPTDLLVLPHFLGAATPYMDLGAKGAFVNLTLETGAGDIYRAIMEGCTFEMRINSERVKQYGVNINELTATGGGAKSKEWLQLKADIMGVPVYTLENEDAGITGAAMLAFTALNYVDNLEHAASILVRKKRPFMPNISTASIYDKKFEKYKKLYRLLQEVR